MEIIRNTITVADFDAVYLLADLYPVSDRVYDVVAPQADELIHAEAAGIAERYTADLQEPLLNWSLYRKRNFLQAIHDGVFQRLETKAEFGPFVRQAVVTRETRFALFCYRPDYDATDMEFELPKDYAADLVPYYHGMKRALLRSLVEYDEFDEPDSYPEDDLEYQRLTDVIKKLQAVAGPVDVRPLESEILYRDKSSFLNRSLKDWGRVLRTHVR